MSPSGRFRRIEPDELLRLLEGESPPLLLDVRREGAFDEAPAIPGAVGFPLDREPTLVPDVDAERPIVTYCL